MPSGTSVVRKKAFVFPTWNSNSIVRDQDLTAKLPDAMAMSVMYGTNKPKNAKADTDNPQAQKAADKLAGGGPEDPFADIVAGILSLGAIITGATARVKPAQVQNNLANPSVQYGI